MELADRFSRIRDGYGVSLSLRFGRLGALKIAFLMSSGFLIPVSNIMATVIGLTQRRRCTVLLLVKLPIVRNTCRRVGDLTDPSSLSEIFFCFSIPLVTCYG